MIPVVKATIQIRYCNDEEMIPSTITSMCMIHRCQSSKVSSVSVYERCMALYSSKSKDTTINIKHRHFTKSCYIQNNDNDDAVARETSARNIRRRYGRIRRKRKFKQQLSSKNEDEIDATINKKRENEDDVSQSSDNHPIDDAKSIPKEAQLTGNLLRDRYILSQRPIKYPKTLKGWKDIFNTVWDKYLWTFEGFLLEEKSNRDKHGNILPKEETNDDDDSNEKNKSLQDKATDAANEVASNVQKNISTMKEEAPKLIQLGQQITGVTTKEELREWVGEQLKLGTACLAEFMKGYRKGRDDEVDRMLHQYFKEEEKSQADGGNDNKVNSIEDDTKQQNKQKRSWGRRERRRQKQSNTSKSATSLEVED